MPRPCKECPFSPSFETRYRSENVIFWLGLVARDGGQVCHLTEDRDCEGARRFFAGEEGVFPSLLELAEARAKDSLAAEFVYHVERLMRT